jgi:amino acid transporter
MPEIFARLHPRRRTPDHAMALQAGLTAFFIIFGGGFRRESTLDDADHH